MRISRLSVKLGILVTAVIILSMGGLLLKKQRSNPGSTSTNTQPTNVKQATTASLISVPGLPVRLKIPKIGVDSGIDSLGLTAQGDMDAPKALANAGWYNVGTRPGSIGNAVINGHFGGTENRPAVFDKLHTLQKGDLLNVQDGKGDTHNFIIREMRIFQPDEDANIVFKASDNKAHLNLITCQGSWDKGQQSYSARLVVFTDLLVN